MCPVLQPCDSSAFTVLAELRRCGLTDSETCLKSVTLSLDGAQTVSGAWQGKPWEGEKGPVSSTSHLCPSPSSSA